MAGTTVTLPGLAYAEIARAIKPHVSRDKTRPMLTHVNVRFDGRRIAFEATDSYSFMRSTFTLPDPIDGDRGEPFEAILPGAHLLSLRPGRFDDVTITATADRAEISCGVLTIRLPQYDMTDSRVPFPDYDELIRKGSSDFTDPRATVHLDRGIGLNPQLLARCAGLPFQMMHVRFIAERSPVMVVSQGAARHEGILMPIRLNDDTVAQHEDWAPAPAAKPARSSRRKKAA